MSWGERSCAWAQKHPCPEVERSRCTEYTCNVDCPSYKWDGVTKKDSQPKSRREGRK